MKKKLSLVFFGSGPVAAASLNKLAQLFYIEAIITKPATEKEMARCSPGTPIFAVSNKDELDALIDEQTFSSHIGVLIDFGIIVSQNVIDSFSKGIVNSHFSLLPELRGADPISFAILEGKERTGVSLMLLVEAMDEGPIIAQAAIDLKDNETTPLLTDSLIDISYLLIKDHLENYVSGKIEPIDQMIFNKNDDISISYTRKLTKQDGVIDWNKTATEIEREIRAYSGWPKSRTKLGNTDVVILNAKVINESGPSGKPYVKDGQLRIFCKSNALEINQLLPAGKKAMDSKAFLAGYRERLGL